MINLGVHRELYRTEIAHQHNSCSVGNIFLLIYAVNATFRCCNYIVPMRVL